MKKRRSDMIQQNDQKLCIDNCFISTVLVYSNLWIWFISISYHESVLSFPGSRQYIDPYGHIKVISHPLAMPRTFSFMLDKYVELFHHPH